MTSILMDYVTKDSRAKWASFQTVTAFGWSGSAFLGGIIVDHYGFDTVFFVTAGMQALGMCVQSLLLGVVLSEENKVPARRVPSSNGRKADSVSNDSLHTPLLDDNGRKLTQGSVSGTPL